MYFTASKYVNHWIDISETIEQKVQALLAHESQMGEWATNGGLRREMVKWAEDAARQSETGFSYAEGFQRVVIEREQEEAHSAEAMAVETQAEEVAST